MSVYKNSVDNHPILARIGQAAMYEQLAEEASELTHAALKMARVLRNENPTPVLEREARQNVYEEFTDVYQCAEELGVTYSRIQIRDKTRRFLKRWEESKKDDFNYGGTD